MIGALPLNLVLSLIFGAGQVVVGAVIARYSLAPVRRLEWRAALLSFVGLWFVLSGVIELFVSGMEASQRVNGAPSAATFALLRSQADATLFVASGLLAVGALLWPLAARWRKKESSVGE